MGGSTSQDHVALGSRIFSIERLVGKGKYGKVHVIVERGAKKPLLLALKRLSKAQILKNGDSCVRSMFREKEFLENLKHPFLVNLHATMQTEHELLMFIDFVPGGDLYYHLQNKDEKWSESRARFYASNIICALEYIHANDIIHRDLKPENVMLDAEGYAHLTDFNIATKLNSQGVSKGFAGTLIYMAPEVLINGETYGPEVDIWSLGILLFEMLFGNTPWGERAGKSTRVWIENNPTCDCPMTGVEHKDIIKRITRCKVKIPRKCSPEASDLLNGILKCKKDRLTLPQIKTHAFFGSIDWHDILAKKVKAPFTPQNRANVSPEVLLHEAFGDHAEELKKESKKIISEKDQLKFLDWDWLLPEYRESGSPEKKFTRKKTFLKTKSFNRTDSPGKRACD